MADHVVLIVNGKELTNNEIIINLKVSGDYKNAVQEMLKQRAVKAFAEANSIEVSDEELQNYVNNKRKQMGIVSSQATQQYFASLGITADQWIDSLEYEFLKSKVKEQVINDDRVEAYFTENKLLYDEIELFKLTADSKDVAEELFMEIHDDNKQFQIIAAQNSKDDATRLSGGYLGRIKRGMLPPNIEAKVFTAAEGDLLGPFEMNNKFEIYLVNKIIKSELTDNLKRTIKDALFNMWLSSAVQSLKIDAPKPQA